MRWEVQIQSFCYIQKWKKNSQHLYGWVMNWTSSCSYEYNFYLIDRQVIQIIQTWIIGKMPFHAEIPFQNNNDLRDSIFFIKNDMSCESLSTGQAQEVIGICLRHGRNQARLPSHYLPIPLHETDSYPYFMHPLLESELMLQKKEIPEKLVKEKLSSQILHSHLIFIL